MLESRAVDAPHVAVHGRQRAAVGQPFHSLPRKRYLRAPAVVHVVVPVQRAVYVNGMPQAGKIPIEKTVAFAARMNVAADAVDHQQPLPRRIPLGNVVGAARIVHVLPDPEHFVNRVQRVDFELVVGVARADENFQVVVFPDFRVALRQRGPHVGLLRREAEIKVFVVPQHRDTGLEPRPLARHDIDERRGFRGRLPVAFIEPAVDPDRTRRAVTRIMCNLLVVSPRFVHPLRLRSEPRLCQPATIRR